MTDPLFLLDSAKDDVPINADEIHEGWKLALPAQVRRHAIGSMRLQDGDPLQLSDGRGLKINAAVRDAAEGVVEVRSFEKEPAPLVRLGLIQALAKTGHDEQAIDMATQIGVDAVIPWQAQRSIARWKDGKTDRKWASTLAAATEQSRRAWMPELFEVHSSKDVVAEIRRANVRSGLVVVLHQDATGTWEDVEGRVLSIAASAEADGKPRTVWVAVGPEGGISDQEIAMFRDAGAEVALLGSNILRAATAGPVALSLLSRTVGRIR